jgi:hypothetical protein
MARILHILLDLAFLPTRSRVAELGLEHIVAGHRQEPGIDLPFLATADPIHRRLHVVVDAASRHATEHPEPMHMSVKQHLIPTALITDRFGVITGCD